MAGTLNTHSITFTRTSKSTLGANGKFTKGTGTPLPTKGSLQPLRGSETNILPQGKSSSDFRWYYTKTELRSDNQHTKLPADECTINGTPFEVFRVEDWTGFSTYTDHYKCLLIRKEQAG